MVGEKRIIAIDGPAGAGKSAVARLLAARLGLSYVDTGAIYRALALLAVEAGIPLPPDGAGVQKLVNLARQLRIRFGGTTEEPKVFLGDREVTSALRNVTVSKASSMVSAIPEVRAQLLPLQRALGEKGAVVEGRDIGTVVFPDAYMKFFLTARPEVRAQRRLRELRASGSNVDFTSVLEEIRQRDLRDATREVCPLRPAADAIVIDTSHLRLEEVVQELTKLVLQRQGVR
ncbi:MAG: (d)CMP kinase [Thermoanaerobaculaceae bacterium]